MDTRPHIVAVASDSKVETALPQLDLNDDAAEVTTLANLPRAYALLGELNNRPRKRLGYLTPAECYELRDI